MLYHKSRFVENSSAYTSPPQSTYNIHNIHMNIFKSLYVYTTLIQQCCECKICTGFLFVLDFSFLLIYSSFFC